MDDLLRPSVALGAVGTVRGKVRYGDQCLREVAAAASTLVDELGLLADAPFSWISVVISYSASRAGPVVRAPNRAYGDLPISVAVPMTEVLRVSREATCDVIARAVAECLVAAAEKHQLGSEADREELAAFAVSE